MHGRNCVPGQPSLFEDPTGGGADAIVHSVSWVFDDLLSVDDGKAAARMA